MHYIFILSLNMHAGYHLPFISYYHYNVKSFLITKVLELLTCTFIMFVILLSAL